MAREIHIPLPGGGAMRGWASGEGEVELETVEHEGPDGTKFVETRWQRVEAAPPAPEAPASTPETPAGG